MFGFLIAKIAGLHEMLSVGFKILKKKYCTPGNIVFNITRFATQNQSLIHSSEIFTTDR